MLDIKIVICDCEIENAAEFGAATGFYFETWEEEMKVNDFLDGDDIARFNEFVGGIDNNARDGEFANGFHRKDILCARRGGANNAKGDDLETIWVYEDIRNNGNLAGGLNANDWSADKAACVD